MKKSQKIITVLFGILLIAIFLSLFFIKNTESKIGAENPNETKTKFIRSLQKMEEYMIERYNYDSDFKYRKPLILSDKPSGYVHKYGFQFEHFHEDFKESEIQFFVNLIAPEEIFSKNIELLLDDKKISYESYGLMMHLDDSSGVEVNLFFIVNMNDLLDCENIQLVIGKNKDPLIQARHNLKEDVLEWHENLINGSRNPNEGVMVYGVSFLPE